MSRPRKDIINGGKVCINCSEWKLLEEFPFRTKLGYHKNSCKKCEALRTKEYQKNNKEKCQKRSKIWEEKNKEKRKSQNKKWRTLNRDNLLSYMKEYSEKNRPILQIKRKTYQRKKYNSDENYKLRMLIGGRIRRIFNHQRVNKGNKSIELLGCDLNFLKSYIENKFKDGMSWDKFKLGEIHIDHIKPCASFDLTDPEQQKECFHYSNLQPLWAVDNLKKGAKIYGHVSLLN